MDSDRYKEADLTKKIIGLAMKVHNEIGPGFPEKIYHQAMIVALSDNKFDIESEKEYNICYQNTHLGTFRLDIIVNSKVVIELKAVVGEVPKAFQAQTISYLKASGLEIALLINFGNESLTVKRLARYKNFNKNKSV
ncbi:MAG: GxxExxY protein [bacterium]|nr:GxxExxY protein [bacterium]